MIMFYVYILKSLKDDKLYIGSTNDLKRRLSEHNKGLNRSTKARRPFEIRYYEACKSEDEGQRLGDPLLQLGDGGFGIGKAGPLTPRKPRRGTFGVIGRDGDLQPQRKHVSDQAQLREDIGLDVLGRRMGLGLVQNGRKRSQRVGEEGNGGVNDILPVGSAQEAAF